MTEYQYTGYLRPYLPLIYSLADKSAMDIAQACWDAGARAGGTQHPYYCDMPVINQLRSMAGIIRGILERRGVPVKKTTHRGRYEDVLPADIAEKQRSWERDQSILRARQAGVTLREIGKGLGLSGERVRSLEARALRNKRKGNKAPIEHYLEQSELGLINAIHVYSTAGRLTPKAGWKKPTISTLMEFSSETL